MKKLISLFMLVALVVFCVAGCGVNDSKDTSKSKHKGTNISVNGSETGDMELLSGKHHVEIAIANKGTIAVELDADVAPISVTNFINLAKSGFYDGKTFHRIINGFMMQGGAYDTSGFNEETDTIKGEFSSNGVENNIKHVRGVISMARAQDNDSASSQFFIMHQDAPHLDGEYAAFGMVTSGMEIVDDICENTPEEDSNGTIATENQPVMEKVTVID